MTIKTKVLLTVIAGLVAGALGIVAVLFQSQNQIIRSITEQTVREAGDVFTNLEKNDVVKLKTLMEVLLWDENIKKLYLQKDREKLHAYTAELYKKLNEQGGVTNWNFILPEPDPKIFLRVHMPKEHSDLMKRAVFQASARNKDYAAGKEIGKAAFALRVVHPYYAGEKLVGYLELGQSIDHFFEIMKNQTGNECSLLMKKQYLDPKEWNMICEKKHLPNHWEDLKDYVMVKNTGANQAADIPENLEAMPETGVVLKRLAINGKVYARGMFPVFDALHRKVGGVLIMRDITQLYQSMLSTRNKVAGLILAIILVLSVTIVLTLNKLVFHRVHTMISNITDISLCVVGGDYDSQLAISGDDEIGNLEKTFEQFRAAVVSALKQTIK